MSSFICQGWRIFFYPLFDKQWVELSHRVRTLKTELSKEEFIKGLNIGIKEKITQDPFASHFVLHKPLHRYGRLKKMGLPARYRLFFRAFKEQKIIIIIWLGFPRKEGDKNDCYQVFAKKVTNVDFPESVDALLAECEVTDFKEQKKDSLETK
jgi:toxin YhaV